MWALWIFGDNIEDYLGHFAYLLFYLACGFAASVTHILLNLGSRVPSVGASGAIAGVIMWIPGSLPFLLAVLWLVVTSLRAPRPAYARS